MFLLEQPADLSLQIEAELLLLINVFMSRLVTLVASVTSPSKRLIRTIHTYIQLVSQSVSKSKHELVIVIARMVNFFFLPNTAYRLELSYF